MHDGYDVGPIRFDTIQQAVGKLRNERAPELPPEWRTGRWGRRQLSVGALDRFDEVQTEALHLALVEVGRGNEFVLGVWMKLDASHRRAARAFLITFSAGIAATFPDLISRRRCSASWSQSLSTSVSTWGSRLDMRRCARRARALRGNLKAFDSRSRARVLMAESYQESVQCYGRRLFVRPWLYPWTYADLGRP